VTCTVWISHIDPAPFVVAPVIVPPLA
jgi:hypothetical protein